MTLTTVACSSKSGGPGAGGRKTGDECDPDAGATGPSLLTNGSVEQPAVPVGGFTAFTTGQSFGGWTVIGETGDVAPLSTAYVSGGFAFTAQDGQQAVDMTGTTDTATGIQQTVTTTAGHAYCLSFWVGNIYNPGGVYGVDSTINVLLDGNLISVATNADQDPAELSWQPFTTTIVAAGSSTRIAFVNADPAADSSNFIDNVTLR